MYTKIITNVYAMNSSKNARGIRGNQYSVRYTKKPIESAMSFSKTIKQGKGEKPSLQVDYEFTPFVVHHKKARNSLPNLFVEV